MKTDDIIFVLVHSLKYEADPTQAQIVTREEYWRMKAQRKERRDQFIERVGPSKFDKEVRDIRREAARKQFDKQIMQRFKVGPNYRENRWFMEQVLPCYN